MARTVTVSMLSQMLSAGLARAGMIFYTILMLTRHSKAWDVPATLFPAHELSKSRGARAPVDTVVANGGPTARTAALGPCIRKAVRCLLACCPAYNYKLHSSALRTGRHILHYRVGRNLVEHTASNQKTNTSANRQFDAPFDC